MKNYNAAALRGEDITDAQHAEAMGIVVPQDVLNTPKYNDYILDRMHESNVEFYKTEVKPGTTDRYTDKEALEMADTQRKAAKENINKLLSKSK